MLSMKKCLSLFLFLSFHTAAFANDPIKLDQCGGTQTTPAGKTISCFKDEALVCDDQDECWCTLEKICQQACEPSKSCGQKASTLVQE